MSKRQLEEWQEREQAQAVARAIGMPFEELVDQDWSIAADVGNDGTVYGYVVTLENGQRAYIGPSELDCDPHKEPE